MKRLFVLSIVALFAIGCSKGPTQKVVETKSEVFPVKVEATAEVVSDQTAVVYDEPEGVLDPCETEVILGVNPIEDGFVDEFIEQFLSCDPTGRYFTFDGKLRSDGFYEPTPGRYSVVNIQIVNGRFRYLESSFEILPVMVRRGLVEIAAPKLAEVLVDYLHEDHINDWLLELDWERDIASLDPDWYLGTDWPEDRTRSVSIEGYHEDISKLDLWVRMWWLRRGEAMFTVAKEAVSTVSSTS